MPFLIDTQKTSALVIVPPVTTLPLESAPLATVVAPDRRAQVPVAVAEPPLAVRVPELST